LARLLKIDKLLEYLNDYIKVKLELLKVYLVDKIAEPLNILVASVVLLFLSFYFFLFLNFALANILNAVLSSNFWGYIIVAGLYLILIIAVIFYFRSGHFKKLITNFVLKLNEHKQ